MNARPPSSQSTRWVAALFISGVGLAGVGYSLATKPKPAPRPVVFVPQQVELRTGTPTTKRPESIAQTPAMAIPDGVVRPVRKYEYEPVPKLESGMTIDINVASAEQLELLPGIGPSRASAIIKDRASRGPFRTVGDLARVSGIGPVTVEGVRPYVRIEGAGGGG